MTERGRQQDDEYWYDYYAQVQSTDRPPAPVAHSAATKGEGTRVWWLVVASVVIAAVAIGLMAVA